MLNRILKIQMFIIFMMLTQVGFAQTKDLVITKKNGPTSYISVGGISELTFDASTTGTVTDIEGNTYNTVKIGNQWWMADNLKVTKYRNGIDIPNVSINSIWAGLTSGAFCAYNNDTNDESDTYGYLYNWYAVMWSDLAPEGWHVPTDAEWTILADYLGGGNVAGGKMKERGFSHWQSSNTEATNESGFVALPAGERGSNGTFYYIGYRAFFWSASE